MRPFGVYVHIPFCSRRCDYCAFATWTDRTGLAERYVAACRTEIALAGLGAVAPASPGVGAARAALGPATSVFFGGGTPSLIRPELLTSIISDLALTPGAEVTVECNPENVTPALLAAYRDGGVNRLSFGVQSMVPHVLAGLGRAHDPGAVVAAAAVAVSAGFSNWNMDLIYGGAGETDDDWLATLEAVVALGPPHVSAYALTVEPGTPLARDVSRHPDDDAQAARYLAATEILAGAGLESYEISNWARPGFECRHNLLYWQQGDYRGIGCAAHSHAGGLRWWNVRTPERYIEAIEAAARAAAPGPGPAGPAVAVGAVAGPAVAVGAVAGPAVAGPAVAGFEELDAPARRRERLELSLRTREGVPAGTVADEELLIDAGFLARMGTDVVLTPTGRLMANEVAIRLRD